MSIKSYLSFGFLALLANAGYITTAQPQTQINAGASLSTNLVGGLLGGVGNVVDSTASGIANTLGNTVNSLGSTVGNVANGVGSQLGSSVAVSANSGACTSYNSGSSSSAGYGQGTTVGGLLGGLGASTYNSGSFSSNGLQSTVGSVLNTVGNVLGGIIPNVNLSQSATCPSPYISNQVNVQPIYDVYQQNSNGYNQRYTCAWQHPHESHSTSQVIDAHQDVRLKHRWSGSNGKSHYSQHWTDHNTGVAYHHTIREASDGCVHQIIVAIDLNGNFQTSHTKTDAYGQKFVINDCPNASGALVTNLDIPA